MRLFNSSAATSNLGVWSRNPVLQPASPQVITKSL